MGLTFYDNDFPYQFGSNGFDTVIRVVDEDTFTTAAEYENACCLNFASHKRPGGGWKGVKDIRGPIRTQEEDLFRRSNLPELMDISAVRDAYYPLSGTQCLFCDGVEVTKDKILNPITPFFTSVVTVPAVVNPNDSAKQRLAHEKARTILDAAAHNKCEVLILGAWGCGVFNNDPEVVSKTFRSFLKGQFAGVFKEVIFAIPGATSENHRIFKEAFHQ